MRATSGRKLPSVPLILIFPELATKARKFQRLGEKKIPD